MERPDGFSTFCGGKVNMRPLLLALLLLLHPALADPQQEEKRTFDEYRKYVAGTYQLDGYFGERREGKPDYTGTLTVTDRGDHFELVWKWEGGGARGVGLLTKAKWTSGEPQFTLSVGSQGSDKNVGVAAYSFSKHHAARGGTVSVVLWGPWASQGRLGFEMAKRTAREIP